MKNGCACWRRLTSYIIGQWHNIVQSRFVISLLRLTPKMLYISLVRQKIGNC